VKLDVLWLAGAEAEMIRLYAAGGDKLYARVHDAIAQLRAMPESAPVYLGRFRRLVLTGSPYGLFYCIEGRRLVVAALLDLRISTERIRVRLTEEF